MDLTHTFTVPTTVEETWAHFQDIAALAECFPGAQVTSADDESFAGTVKVKLGPIALLYTGSGTFVERDASAHRFVVDAKGRDKRGNGTAGAHVTLTMTGSDSGTIVEVITDLAITGKPAQFGRGVMQDVSDKLLGQFVACLEQRMGADDQNGAGAGAGAGAWDGGRDGGLDGGGDGDQDAEPASQPTGAAAFAGPAGDPDAGPASAPAGAPAPAGSRAVPQADDALDLGASLLPVLVRSYGRQVALAVAGLLAVRWLLRRRRG